MLNVPLDWRVPEFHYSDMGISLVTIIPLQFKFSILYVIFFRKEHVNLSTPPMEISREKCLKKFKNYIQQCFATWPRHQVSIHTLQHIVQIPVLERSNQMQLKIPQRHRRRPITLIVLLMSSLPHFKLFKLHDMIGKLVSTHLLHYSRKFKKLI